MKISARNQFKGKITAIEELSLKVGGEAYAIAKAASVMAGVD